MPSISFPYFNGLIKIWAIAEYTDNNGEYEIGDIDVYNQENELIDVPNLEGIYTRVDGELVSLRQQLVEAAKEAI